ncbi:histidine kinase [Streptomyces sp. YIM 98790]|uniref:sensor histidine kinase n=1 Tax=Streptomyces sp. YIM 98790 TaxID=2689077 RepID=UPI0028BDF825|nr:histidine kinase [Streptomyces sp. YIM 98790]
MLRRAHRGDVLAAAAGLLSGLLLYALELQSPAPAGDVPRELALIPLTVLAGTELLRRTAPLAALPVALGALAADVLAGSLLASLIMFTDAVYAAVLYGPHRVSRLLLPGCGVVTVCVTAVSLAVWRDAEALLLGALAGLVTIGPAWTGVIVREHRSAAVAERLRAEQTALLAERDRVQAVAAERARMARELHDLVANHLTAIAIRSAAALRVDEPAATRDALRSIRENSTAGLTEMRRLIGLLRSTAATAADSGATPGGAAVVPTLAGLDALLRQIGAAGSPGGLRVVRRGEPPAGLPAPVELAAYRIIQESLTNAVKHAAAGEVVLDIDPRPDMLVLTVTSPLPDHRAAPRAPGAGHGLTGMRERAALLGGTLTAGPGPDPGTWRVRAGLPCTAPPDGTP